ASDINMKVVALFLGFATHIYTPQSDTRSLSYDLRKEACAGVVRGAGSPARGAIVCCCLAVFEQF
ncbi:hypothetical protein A2U01_0109057, partial [Trifolium medium]|nr:hypothetical protein [Trifolium medium]